MKAIVIREPGGPEVLEWREVDDPRPGPGEVVVRVRATAVNRADVLQRLGRYPAPPGVPPDIPGLEFAGTVEARGPGVDRPREGDAVFGLLGGGGYAERVVTAAATCLPIPAGVDWTEAAATAETFLTAYDALRTRAGLLRDESLFVHAAGSGVGSAACILARAWGATVHAGSRDPERGREIVRRLAVESVLDPWAEGSLERLREATSGGVHVVLDLVGAGAWGWNVSVLRTGGRMVLVGLLSGARAEVRLDVLLAKRLTLIGTVLRSRPLEDKIALTLAFERDVLPLLASGAVRPVVDRVVPLERAAEAHRAMEAGEHLGKIVLGVDEPPGVGDQSRP